MKLTNRNKAGKARRVREAKARNEKFSALSPIDQLASLDERLGKGKGAAKQRALLTAKIKASK